MGGTCGQVECPSDGSACGDCVAANCCGEIQDCFSSPECVENVACFVGCIAQGGGPVDCFFECGQDPDAINTVVCLAGNCSDSCF